MSAVDRVRPRAPDFLPCDTTGSLYPCSVPPRNRSHNIRQGCTWHPKNAARRMLIENALSDAVRFFHMDALSSTVGLKADFDMALLVVASGLYRLLARRMRGYSDAQARHIFRDIVDMPADINITENLIEVSFHRRSHLPIILASGLVDQPVKVPWWNGMLLKLTTYLGPRNTVNS